RLRKPHVIVDLELGADSDAVYLLRLDAHLVGTGVLLDGDARQHLARRGVADAAGDALGPHFDRRAVAALRLDGAVGVRNLQLAPGRESVAARPLVRRPARELADRHLARRGCRDEERDQNRPEVVLHRVGRRSSRARDQLSRTDTSLDTPGSSIVTP